MIHGILNVYKEKGYTSHDVVAKLRRIVGQKKIGHTGTLDPEAEGVLPVCLGKGTKLSDLLTDKDKTYETVMLLGRVTDTQDVFGNILSEHPALPLEEEVREAVCSFQGEYDQIPPMYSALKVGGKKLYELAREGKVVERPSRRVTIYDIEIIEIELPRVRMRVMCSKGTYIRTLCHDIGEKLGCGGCMEELKRIRAGRFSVSDALTLDEIGHVMEEGRIEEIVTPVDRVFEEYPEVCVKKALESAARNGSSIPEEGAESPAESAPGEKVRMYDEDGNFIGLYRWEEQEKKYRLIKMFFPEI